MECWSVKGDGRATVDCDIAIDYCGTLPADFAVPGYTLAQQWNPYRNQRQDQKLMRLKLTAA